MTIDEAIKNREDCLKYLEGRGEGASPDCVEAVRWSVKALKALRPVSRERVEKVWRASWNPVFEDWRNQIEGDKCSACGFEHYGSQFNFCPNCGAPMTDEAVEMVMERWKEAVDNG